MGRFDVGDNILRDEKEELVERIDSWMRGLGFVNHTNFYAHKSDSEATATLSKRAAAILYDAWLKDKKLAKAEAYTDAANLMEFDEKDIQSGSYREAFLKWAKQEKTNE